MQNPLLLSLIINMDGYSIPRNDVSHKLYMFMPFVGINIMGIKAIDKNIHIEYSAGYGYLFSGYYTIDAMINQSLLRGGHRFDASIGMIYSLDNFMQFYNDRKIDLYVRLKGLYYDINASEVIIIQSQPTNYPASKNFAVLFEFGIIFDSNYKKLKY